jgi:hypothetical protein
VGKCRVLRRGGGGNGLDRLGDVLVYRQDGECGSSEEMLFRFMFVDGVEDEVICGCKLVI